MRKITQNIYIAGHAGLVGSALFRLLKKDKNNHIITKDKKQLNLSNQNQVNNFFRNEKIDQVYIAAAKVGGIYANNTYPAEFIYENLILQTNIIQAAFENRVKKLLFLGSSCIYPRLAYQPIKEDQLLTGALEPTNEPYAIAKIAGIKMCESYNRQYMSSHKIDYRAVMPTNLYGPCDNYHPKNSHVIPALIRRFHEAKIKKINNIEVWGTGNQKREFLHVDDLARACVHIMNLDASIFYKNKKKLKSHCNYINIGFGIDITIKDLAKIIKNITGYKGTIKFDKNKSDGPKQKLLDSKRIFSLGWKPQISLENGLINVYEDFKKSL